MNPVDVLEEALATSQKAIAALILQTYSVLNEQFKLVKANEKRTHAYQILIDEFCQKKCGAANLIDRNSPMVQLNVGGKVHIIKRSIMLSEGDHINFLYLIIFGRWDYLLPKDCNGVIFVDLDPALVTPILDKLRFRSNYGTDEQMMPRISMDRRTIFNSVVSYYRIGSIVYGHTDLSEESRIKCMNDPNNILLLHSFLPADFTEMRLRFKLLYRGSRDGMTAATFHQLCDSKDDTVSVIEDTNGNVFGGFADKAWSTKSSRPRSQKSFLFSLKSSMGDGVVKFPVNLTNPNSLLHHSTYMCAFGNGDLYIIPENSESAISIGTSYQNPSSAYSRQYCTGGHKTFTVHEIEVYGVLKEGSKAPPAFSVDDSPVNLTSSIRTEQLPVETMSDPTKVSRIYTSQTSDLASMLLNVAQTVQKGEERLLLELMWIEHLSVPMSKRNLSAGLLAEWRRICEESADVLPISNGEVVASGESATLTRIEESMARLQIKIGPKRKRDSSEGRISSSMVSKETESVTNDTAADDVISFNVGGTIIAALRSTLLLQAPNSTFAAKYSDRWVQQPDELDKCGNIYMVKARMLSFHLYRFHFHRICLLCSLFPCYSKEILICPFGLYLFIVSSSK